MNINNFLEGTIDKDGYYELSTGTSNPIKILDEVIGFLTDLYDPYPDTTVWRYPLNEKDLKLRKSIRELILQYSKYIDELNMSSETEEQDEISRVLDNIDNFLEYDVSNLMSEIAPKGFYYGSNQGNNSSIGFWPIVDEEY